MIVQKIQVTVDVVGQVDLYRPVTLIGDPTMDEACDEGSVP
jgi:hypothetical protein